VLTAMIISHDDVLDIMFGRLLAIIIAVLAVVAGVSFPISDNNVDQLVISSEGDIRSFSWDVFDNLGDGDIAYSPYGLYMAFAMLANGAKDGSDTQKEVLDMLYSSSDDSLNGYIGSLLDMTDTGDAPVTFESRNLVLVDSSFSDGGINGAFASAIRERLGGNVETADFSTDLDGAKEYIREWVEECTHGKIPDFESQATPDTVADLLNAVYFKADWKYRFDPTFTIKEDFTSSDGSIDKVGMMHKELRNCIRYYEDERYEGIELPYASDAHAMYVILPKDHSTGMLDMWRSESLGYRDSFITEIGTAPYADDLILSLPKMDIDVSYDIVKMLDSLGASLSITGAAEYTEIVNGRTLSVDGGSHQVSFTVDEKGTEAAAVTEIVTKCTSLPPKDGPVRFICDVPFVFIVSETSSGTPIFAGYFGNQS